MSLRYLLPADGVTELLGSWPDEPRLYEREATELDRHVDAGFFETWAFSGCVPAAEVAVMNHGANPPRPSINPAGFMTNGRTDGNRLRGYYEQGYTIRLGNLQRVVPFLNGMSRHIQRETHLESPRVWQEHWREEWESAGPDRVYELRPGQSLLLPRGWIHNPHAKGATEDSIHLTFAIRERSPFWLAEKLTAGAIEAEEFRRIILPGEIQGDGLTGELLGTRQALIRYLERLDVDKLTPVIRDAALSELEYTT